MSKEQRNFKGVWIPKEIWINDKISLLEKVILVEIDSLEDEEKGCYASNKYFADFFKLSNGRISQIITSLKEKGYIEINYIYFGKEIKERQIRIKRPPYPDVFNKLNTYLENDDRGIKKIKEGYLENAKENNTNINNTSINNINNNICPKFKKPTLEEISKYCNERNNNVDPQYFLDYYESNGWKVGRNSMKDWKAAIRTWERNNFNDKNQNNKKSSNPFLDYAKKKGIQL